MNSYLTRPLSINQSQYLLKFFTAIHHLKLISDTTYIDMAYIFDEYMWEQLRLSWEVPPIELFSNRV